MNDHEEDVRVHLAGWPHLTGTIIDGDEWCDRVTVKWDEGRTIRIYTDRLVAIRECKSVLG